MDETDIRMVQFCTLCSAYLCDGDDDCGCGNVMSDATCGGCWSGCGLTSGSGAFCLRGVRCGESGCLLDNSGDVFSLFSLSDVVVVRNDGAEFLQGNKIHFQV